MAVESNNDHTLNLLTYNIQAASQTSSYREYVTKSWKQLIPHRHQLHNLNAIGDILGEYDFVGLQEVDAGSFRSGFINQTRYLAGKAGFPFWFTQPNRDYGHIAKHSNGLLSRYQPSHCVHRKLPGMPGRGLLIAEFGYGGKLIPSFPGWLIDGKKPSRLAWFLKERVLPPVYWQAMLRGREWLAKPEKASSVVTNPVRLRVIKTSMATRSTRSRSLTNRRMAAAKITRTRIISGVI